MWANQKAYVGAESRESIKSCEMLNFKQMTGEKQWEAKSQMLLEFNFQMRGEAVAGQ